MLHLLWKLSAVIACASYSLLFKWSALRCAYPPKSCEIQNMWFRLGFYCLPFYKTGHAMTELWSDIILTWNWMQNLLGLQMEPKGTIKCHRNAGYSEESSWRYFKVGTKTDSLFPKIGRTISSFSHLAKVRLCLCDTRQYCVPDSSAIFQWFGMGKQHSRAEILVWLTEAVWFSYHGKSISLRQDAMWHWCISNASSFVTSLSSTALLGADVPRVNVYLWKTELWPWRIACKGLWRDETSYVPLWL